MKKNSTLLYSFKTSLPVMAGYIVLGIGFGMLLGSKGYNWVWALVMSALIYAGSMQYVAVELLASGAPLITAAIMTVMVNIRHLFYGITMLDKYRDTKPYKPYLIFALTDETFSLVCTPKLPDNAELNKYYFYVSLFDHSYWIIGSVLGNLLGNIIPFPTTGVEFSMTALFVVIFINQWESTKEHKPALAGVGISVICLIIFGADSFLVPSMLLITASMFLGKRFLKEGAVNG